MQSGGSGTENRAEGLYLSLSEPSGLEGLLKAALERLESLEQHLEVLRKRHRSLKRRTQRALERLQAAIGELEEAARFGDDGWHVRNALEILYDVVHDLERGGEA